VKQIQINLLMSTNAGDKSIINVEKKSYSAWNLVGFGHQGLFTLAFTWKNKCKLTTEKKLM